MDKTHKQLTLLGAGYIILSYMLHEDHSDLSPSRRMSARISAGREESRSRPGSRGCYQRDREDGGEIARQTRNSRAAVSRARAASEIRRNDRRSREIL